MIFAIPQGFWLWGQRGETFGGNMHNEQHNWKPCASCFKYGNECQFPYLRQITSETKFEENNDDDGKVTLWSSLEKDSVVVFPSSIESKRALGSQYLNTHSKYITRLWDAFAIFRLEVQGVLSLFPAQFIHEGSDNSSAVSSGFAVSNEELEDEMTKMIQNKAIDKLRRIGAKDQL
jgi:hypothetical protein